MIGGIVGSDQDHHAAPYAITEEFVAVYRLHPLLPDDYDDPRPRDRQADRRDRLRADPGPRHPADDRRVRLVEPALLVRRRPTRARSRCRTTREALTNHVRLNGDRVDLGTIDILRDRERGVPRYNDFREQLRKSRIERFEDLTDDPELAEEIRDVYDDDIDQVDLQVGLLAEPLPPGFGFSDTAFRIFILMASRRLKSDRFFTNDYSPDVYTPEGIDWVESNTMSDVLLRHHPELGPGARRRRQRVRALEQARRLSARCARAER